VAIALVSAAQLSSGAENRLPGFLHSLGSILDHYGYAAVLIIVLIESFGPPLPGETIIIAASIYASAGSLNIWAVAAIAFGACVVGDNVGYLIGRRGGRALVERYGRYLGATEERYGKVEAFFERHGGKIVVIARFVEGLRQLNGIVAGTTKMPWLKFLTAQVFGAAVWVAVWCTLGYTAGSHITTIYDAIAKVGYGLIALLVLAIVVYVVRRRRSHGDPTDTRAEELTHR
jgi:membrane protein DedA with SNARE-associated domain